MFESFKRSFDKRTHRHDAPSAQTLCPTRDAPFPRPRPTYAGSRNGVVRSATPPLALQDNAAQVGAAMGQWNPEFRAGSRRITSERTRFPSPEARARRPAPAAARAIPTSPNRTPPQRERSIRKSPPPRSTSFRTPLRRSSLERLCRRERQILSLAGEGLSNKALASALYLSVLSVRTVEGHLGRISCQTGRNRTHRLHPTDVVRLIGMPLRGAARTLPPRPMAARGGPRYDEPPTRH